MAAGGKAQGNRYAQRRLVAVGLLLSLLVVKAGPLHGADATDRVRVYWAGGQFEIDLYGEAAPRHVANFLRYVDIGAYDWTFSHRSSSGASRFIQGGGYFFPEPFSPEAMDDYFLSGIYGNIKNEYGNGLVNSPGTLAAARQTGLDTASAGWFINVTDNSAGFVNYTVYGEVVSGWDSLASLTSLPYAYQAYPQLAGSGVATAPVAYFSSTGQYEPPKFFKWVRTPLIPGDFNLDGYVDSLDEAVWQAGQGSGTSANLTADANGDSVVDEDDLAIFQQNLGAGQPVQLVGDFNGNGVVNEADYLWWTTTLGSTTTLDADANGDGIVSLADLTLWRDHRGASLPASVMAVGAQVPEPRTGILAGLMIVAVLLLSRTSLVRAKKAGLE